MGHASGLGVRTILIQHEALQATKHVALFLELFKPVLDDVLRETNKAFEENEIRKPLV